MTSSPLYLSSRPLHLCHHTKPIDDITATTWKVLHAVYLWYRIPYVFDKISTKYDITTLCVDVTTLGICLTSFALQMTLHPLYHTKQRYLWCHIPFTHHITRLYQTLHPLNLCHHNLSTDITPLLNDITPTFCVTSYALYRISHPLIMSSLCCTYDITTSYYETTSCM